MTLNAESPSYSPLVLSSLDDEANVNFPLLLFHSYHQKYRLQQHKELTKALKLDSQLLQTSHVAARLNGYLVGVGGMEQFLKEADSLGLTSGMREYVKKELAENEGGSLYC